ncbi:MAG: DUF4190 domain-containing protein [Geodermatophilaceae bacterium]|nr:DUF4190 domain-containing protein [Geodermatophilaceae bacterium]
MAQYPYDPTQPPPGQYYSGPPPPTNTMAILAIVFAFVFSPLGIVFGFIARSQIRQTGEQGDGLALAGIIVGFISIAFVVLAFIIFLGAASTVVGY